MRNSYLRATIDLDHMAFTASDRARARIREEMAKKNLSQTDVANLLEWTQSRMSKILNGRTELGVDELSALCFALGLSMVECVRDHGLEFCADMTPTELRMLERLRELGTPIQTAIMSLLQVQTSTTKETRGLTKSAIGKIHPGRRK